MAKKTDWLPRSRAARLAMARNWVTIVPNPMTDWGIPPAAREAAYMSTIRPDAQITHLLNTRNTPSVASNQAPQPAPVPVPPATKTLNVEDFGGLGVLARIDMTVYPVIYSPDRKRLLAGAEGGGLILDAESGRELLRFEVSFAGFPVAVAYRPDGRRITSGSDDGAVIIWDAESGRELRTIAGEDTVCAAFRPDGNQLVSAGEDGVIRPWGQDTDK